MVLKLFQELRSIISCLILLDIWWCSDLVYKVLIGHVKGLSEVSDNALKPCMSFPGHSCPTGDSRKALLPPQDLSLLESFKDEGYFSPALTKIHTYDSLGIWSDSLGSGDRKQYLEARQDDSIACAVSVYGCKRADKPDEERWGWCCWGELSVWRAFDAVHLHWKVCAFSCLNSVLLILPLGSSVTKNFHSWWCSDVMVMGKAEEFTLNKMSKLLFLLKL